MGLWDGGNPSTRRFWDGNPSGFLFCKGPDSAQLAGGFIANLLSPKALNPPNHSNPSKAPFMGTDALREAEASQSRRQLERALLPHPLAARYPMLEVGNNPYCPMGPSKEVEQLSLMLPVLPGPLCTCNPPCAPQAPLPVWFKVQRTEPTPRRLPCTSSAQGYGALLQTHVMSQAARFWMLSYPDTLLMLTAAGMMEGAESRHPASPPWPLLIPRSVYSQAISLALRCDTQEGC